MRTTIVTGPGPAPQPPGEDEPAFRMHDHLGNPVCPGCHEGPLQWAARQNSRMGVCGCPTGRDLPDVETRAEALPLIRDALAELDQETIKHAAWCDCYACRAARVLRGERVL